MAEYKGLTIRIGGDTSQLNSALKASTKAASSLQSQIRQITRAMRFDPGDLGNVNTRMKLTTDRAEALHSKLTLLKSAYKELGESTVSVGGSAKGVKQLAEETENISLAATAAKERYNDMTKNLAANYRELEARAKDAGKSMNLNALSRQGSDETFETQMAKLKEWKVVTDEEIKKLRELRAVWNEAFDSSEAYKSAEQFQHMAIDMQRFESEAKDAISTVRELNTVSNYSAENWQESTANIKAMDTALDECSKQARAYEAALREDPSNQAAALGRIRAISNEYNLTNDKAKELSRQVSAYKERLSDVIAEHKNLPRYIQETGDKWQSVHEELSGAKGELAALNQSLQRLKDADAPDEEIQKLESQVTKAEGKVDRLKQSAKEMDAAFETAKECSELERLQTELTETATHAKSLEERMSLTSLGGRSVLNPSTVKSAGMTLYSTLTPAITTLGWRAISAAKDIDTAYRDMRKTVDGTETQFNELREAAIEFSKTHVTSAEQILQIEAIGGELGVATEDLQAFAETVSNLDVATNLNTEEAASSLGKLANITHMTADEYDNYADALVRLGNNGASTEDQIVDIATRIGSMGTIVGMSVPEILALSSSIASTGMQTEAAGTAIANTFSDIESAVASGGDSLAAFGAVTETVGMSADEFAQTWESKPIVAFQKFIEGLNQIEADGGSAVSTLEAMGITGERQKQSILGLMQTIGGLNTNLEMSQHAWDGQSDAWGSAGDAMNEANKKAEGFSGQLSILSNIGNDAMAALAEGATPLVAILTDIAQGALGLFEDMSDGAKSFTVLGLAIGAISGPALTAGSTFVIAKQNLSSFIRESTAMGQAISILKQGFVGMGDAMGPPVSKIHALKEAGKSVGKALLKGLAAGAVVAAIVLVGTAISDYVRKVREAEEASKNAGDVIGSALSDSIVQNGNAITDLNGNYDEMVAKMAENNRKLQESAKETYNNTALIEEYGEGVKQALDAYNEGDRSAESMANLKTQLELYNSAAGTSISFTEDEAGKLHLMKDGAELSADAFDRLSQSMINAAKAEFFKEGYEAKMGDYRAALDEIAEAENNVKVAQEGMDAAAAEGDWDTAAQYAEQWKVANETLENAKQKLGETQSAMNQYEEGMKLMAEAQLENASAAVKWVSENDALQAAIWANGESVTDFAHNLDGLGVSYDQLESHSDGIAEMASTWDGSMASMISGLQAMGIELDLSTAKIEGLNAIEIEGKTYWVDDMGTVYDQTGKVVGLKGEIGGIEGTSFEVTDNGTMSESASDARNLTSAIGGVQGKSVDVTANVYGESDVWSLVSGISSVISKTVDIVANTRGFGSATGSIASSPYIPRHAAGYIATGPTLTNNGWVGEAGAEAVLNWGTGGAVVPLTNPRYMEPIADAIARSMGKYSSNPGNVYNITLDYKAGDDANKMVRELGYALRTSAMMEG